MVQVFNTMTKEKVFLQVENEYKPEEMEYGSAGVQYMNWAAQMAVGMDTGVPWVMCKQDDAPSLVVSSIINTHLYVYIIISSSGNFVAPVSGWTCQIVLLYENVALVKSIVSFAYSLYLKRSLTDLVLQYLFY